jgi:hypothetical protein
VPATEGRKSSFFKKRSKKLLSVGFRASPGSSRQAMKAEEQEFFAYFFKKEGLTSSFSFPAPR